LPIGGPPRGVGRRNNPQEGRRYVWNASALKGYPIKASDGQLGTVSDLMYDEADWVIRWVVVDTGDWLSGRRVVLPVSVVGQPDPEAHCVPVRLTIAQVEESAGVESVRNASAILMLQSASMTISPKVAITTFGAITTAKRPA
jgi:hypothetical protein